MRSMLVAVIVLLACVVSAQQATFERGDPVRVKPPTDNTQPAATQLLLQVVAVPGDQIRADGSAVSVNDRLVTGFSLDFIARVASRPEMIPNVVPDGHYFVMGEQRSNQHISEYWGQHSGTRLERVNVLAVRRTISVGGTQ